MGIKMRPLTRFSPVLEYLLLGVIRSYIYMQLYIQKFLKLCSKQKKKSCPYYSAGRSFDSGGISCLWHMQWIFMPVFFHKELISLCFKLREIFDSVWNASVPSNIMANAAKG